MIQTIKNGEIGVILGLDLITQKIQKGIQKEELKEILITLLDKEITLIINLMVILSDK